MAHVAQMPTQEPIYKPSSIFCFKPILLSAHKLTLLIYGDNKNSIAKKPDNSKKTPNDLEPNPKSRVRSVFLI